MRGTQHMGGTQDTIERKKKDFSMQISKTNFPIIMVLFISDLCRVHGNPKRS